MEWILLIYLNKTPLQVGPFNNYDDCRRMGNEYLKYDKKIRNNCVGVAILKERK